MATLDSGTFDIFPLSCCLFSWSLQRLLMPGRWNSKTGYEQLPGPLPRAKKPNFCRSLPWSSFWFAVETRKQRGTCRDPYFFEKGTFLTPPVVGPVAVKGWLGINGDVEVFYIQP
jgi:hypothetical protein